MIPRYCKPCGENLLPEQQECPFCGQTSVPIDEINKRVGSFEESQRLRNRISWRTNIRGDDICALVDAAFALVSRNPSDHESATAYRIAIRTALDLAGVVGERDALRSALAEARAAIASLDEFALGGADIVDTHTGESVGQYGIRDELIAKIDAALNHEASL